MVTRLQVTYKSPEIDRELDKKIVEFLGTLDFICIDKDYIPTLFRRAIFFERRTKEEEENGKFETQYHLKPEPEPVLVPTET